MREAPDAYSQGKMKQHIFNKTVLLSKSLTRIQQSSSRLLGTSGNGNFSATLGIKEEGSSQSDM